MTSHLQRIQNYAARVILRLPMSSRITIHLKSLNWLPVKVRSTVSMPLSQCPPHSTHQFPHSYLPTPHATLTISPTHCSPNPAQTICNVPMPLSQCPPHTTHQIQYKLFAKSPCHSHNVPTLYSPIPAH